MDSEYIAEAMSRANFSFVMRDATFLGSIQGFPGVEAAGATLEECRRNLENTLDGWLFVRKATGFHIPDINRLPANPATDAA